MNKKKSIQRRIFKLQEEFGYEILGDMYEMHKACEPIVCMTVGNRVLDLQTSGSVDELYPFTEDSADPFTLNGRALQINLKGFKTKRDFLKWAKAQVKGMR